MEDMRISYQHHLKENRKFGITVAGIFLLLALYHYLDKRSVSYFFIITSAVLMFLAFFLPQILSPVRRFWDSLGHILGIVNTYFILTLIYVLLFIPLGYAMKLLSKDLLDKKLKPEIKSYWEHKSTQYGSYMKYQF